ncbi:MAG: LysM peptidoglycan-binding domain-containing protein [Planctomycetes bacterium]|nr:LysM peptidoglycan-binding domain-containing protein [Planctomycetota bacterium]
MPFRWRLRWGTRTIEIAERPIPAGSHVLRFPNESSAERFLASLAREGDNLDVLRSVLAEPPRTAAAERLSEADVVRVVARRISLGRFLVVRLPERPLPRVSAPAAEAPAETAEDAASEKTWIRFRVVEDDDRKPVADVKLLIAPPGADEAEHPTDPDGKFEIREIETGTASVRSRIPDAPLASTLDFVGWGEEMPAPGGASAKKEKLSGPLQIRRIETHRVRTGESLDSIAKAAGLTWQQLAKFNWDTDDPKTIDRHLHFEVGCTIKTGKYDYRFDDRDRPGTLLVPGDWSSSGHETGRTHTVRVRRVERRIRVRLDDPFLGFLAGIDVTAKYADGTEEKMRTDDAGIFPARIDCWTEKGNFADLKFKTELREHERRVFLVAEHANTPNGAWQRLVNLGYVADPKPPLEPESPDVLAAFVEAFQAEHGTAPTGDLDEGTVAELDGCDASWGAWARTTVALAEDGEYGANPKEAVA